MFGCLVSLNTGTTHSHPGKVTLLRHFIEHVMSTSDVCSEHLCHRHGHFNFALPLLADRNEAPVPWPFLRMMRSFYIYVILDVMLLLCLPLIDGATSPRQRRICSLLQRVCRGRKTLQRTRERKGSWVRSHTVWAHRHRAAHEHGGVPAHKLGGGGGAPACERGGGEE